MNDETCGCLIDCSSLWYSQRLLPHLSLNISQNKTKAKDQQKHNNIQKKKSSLLCQKTMDLEASAAQLQQEQEKDKEKEKDQQTIGQKRKRTQQGTEEDEDEMIIISLREEDFKKISSISSSVLGTPRPDLSCPRFRRFSFFKKEELQDLRVFLVEHDLPTDLFEIKGKNFQSSFPVSREKKIQKRAFFMTESNKATGQILGAALEANPKITKDQAGVLGVAAIAAQKEKQKK
jgi:hypothetical protein